MILGLFGLMSAGVILGGVGSATWLVLIGLLAGKPLGILLGGVVAAKVMGLRLPERIGPRELVVIGYAAGIGFMVALFVATVAFEPGPVQSSAKLGALGSCAAALVTVLVAKLTGVRKERKPTPSLDRP